MISLARSRYHAWDCGWVGIRTPRDFRAAESCTEVRWRTGVELVDADVEDVENGREAAYDGCEERMEPSVARLRSQPLSSAVGDGWR